MLDAGEQLAGRFELLREIGSGGVARVFAATDLELDTTVALKVLHPHLAANRVIRERFRREVALSRTLEHPGIVRVFDLYEADGHAFYAMELCDGPDLKAVLRSGGPMAAGRRLSVVRQLLEALGAAHRTGVIHRDVKPHNVVLLADGRIKVLDFGLARVESMVGLTSHSVMLGTPEYLAPEALAGMPLDGRADLYSLGVLWFELATGTLPVRADTTFELLRLKGSQDGPPPAGPDVEPVEAAVVERLLRCAPEGRYASVEEVLSALDEDTSPGTALEGPQRVCGVCGETHVLDGGMCLECGAVQSMIPRDGDALLVLVRADEPPAGIVDRLASFGAAPAPDQDPDRALMSTPAVLLKGLDRGLAQQIQRYLLERGFTTEVRGARERNYDLLYGSGLPGAMFSLGLLLGWAAVCWVGWTLGRSAGLIVALAAVPPAAWLLMRRADLFVAPIFGLAAGEAALPGPLAELHREYRRFLEDKPSMALRRLGAQLVRRAQVLLSDLDDLELPSASRAAFDRLTLRAASEGLGVLSALQPVEAYLASVDVRQLWEDLEDAERRARAPAADADRQEGRALFHAEALEKVAEVERERERRCQRVLQLSTRMETLRAELAGSDRDEDQLSVVQRRMEVETELLAAARAELDHALEGAS